MLSVQVVIVGVLAALGAVAYREETAVRRGDPALFRSGLVVFQRSIQLRNVARVLPDPILPNSLFGWPLRVYRFAPTEVAFTAQVTNAPLLKALLRIRGSGAELELTGRVYWGASPLFAVGFGVLPLLFAPAWAGVAWLVLGPYLVSAFLAERRRILACLESVAAQLAV